MVERGAPELNGAVLLAELRRILGRVPERLAVAYSGGMDSHVLLYLLAGLRGGTGWALRALHADHGLVSGSAAWAAHCERVCRGLGVPLLSGRLTVADAGDGLESASRRARYAWLRAVLEPGEILLTAHHRDDQAETVLFRLLRGAGTRGLGSIRPRTRLGHGSLVRPLLAFPRDAIRACADAGGLEWITDTSNDDTRHARNYIRRQVMPALRKRWPAVDRTLARAAANLADAERVLAGVARADIVSCRTRGGPWIGDGLAIAALQALPDPRLRNALRHWLTDSGSIPPAAVLERVERDLVRGHPPRAGLTWKGLCVRHHRGALYVVPEAPPRRARVEWNGRDALELPEAGVRLLAVPAAGCGVARWVLEGMLSVCFRRGGERVRLPGGAHHRSLKKLLQERGVPPWLRARVPLIYAGNELVAAAGLWVFEPYCAAANEESFELRVEPMAMREFRVDGPR